MFKTSFLYFLLQHCDTINISGEEVIVPECLNIEDINCKMDFCNVISLFLQENYGDSNNSYQYLGNRVFNKKDLEMLLKRETM